MHPLGRFFDLIPRRLVKAAAQHHNVISSPLEDAADNERSGNRYKTYSEQVRALSEMYNGEADWGNEFVQMIATLRSYFILGGGVTARIVKGKEEDASAQKSLTSVEAFLKQNGLNGHKLQRWGKQATIEGKACVRLYDKSPNLSAPSGPTIEVRFLPWLPLNYQIETPDDDYETYTKLTYRLPKVIPAEQTVLQANFVYVPFGGLINDVNKTPPLIGGVITQIKNLDRELQRWDAINDLYAAPTPVTTCESSKDAAAIDAALFPSGQSKNFKVGKWLTIGAKSVKVFYMEVSPEGMKSVQDSITNLQQIISGATGVPIQYLGRADQLSQRSTSDDLIQQIIASTNDDRLAWGSFCTEMARKALNILNGKQGDFDSTSVEIVVNEISDAQLHAAVQSWLPTQQSGNISRQTMREHLPGINEKEEVKRLKQDAEEAAKAAEALAPKPAGDTVGSAGKPTQSNNKGREF